MAIYNTYNGWKLRGRQVMEGQRGLFRNEYGDWMFSLNQTVNRFRGSYGLVLVKRDLFVRFVKY